MIRSYCCCINEPVIFSHCVHFRTPIPYVLLKVCPDHDDIVPLLSHVQSDHFKLNAQKKTRTLNFDMGCLRLGHSSRMAIGQFRQVIWVKCAHMSRTHTLAF